MKILLTTLTYFILFYSFFRITFWIGKKTKKRDLYKMIEVYFLEQRFKINVKKLTANNIYTMVALSDAIILTIVLLATSFISDLIIRLIVSAIVLIPVIYIVYYIVSKYLKKRGF